MASQADPGPQRAPVRVHPLAFQRQRCNQAIREGLHVHQRIIQSHINQYPGFRAHTCLEQLVETHRTLVSFALDSVALPPSSID